MSSITTTFLVSLFVLLGNACNQTNTNRPMVNTDEMKIRIAELEIDSVYFEEYIFTLKEEAATSVRLEEGVLCIFPMYEKESPAQIRLVEIYASEEAYQAHLKTPHFLHYKTTTLPMVKSLRLVDMEAIDPETMSEIFVKMKATNKN